MTLYAVRTINRPTPERQLQGCPYTGWVHEGHPPWRVVVSHTRDLLAGLPGIPAPYTGSEATVDYVELLPPRRIRPGVGRDAEQPDGG